MVIVGRVSRQRHSTYSGGELPSPLWPEALKADMVEEGSFEGQEVWEDFYGYPIYAWGKLPEPRAVNVTSESMRFVSGFDWDINEDWNLDTGLTYGRNESEQHGIAGLVIGELLEMKDTDEPFGKTAEEIVLDACAGYDFPIVANFPCGHGACQATLPYAHPVEIHAVGDSPSILIPEAPVV